MKLVIQAVQMAVDSFVVDQAFEVVVSRPEARFGDFSTNIAMQLAKKTGKNPREIADEIVVKLSSNTLFTEVTIAGPGFINMRVADDYYQNMVKTIIEQKEKFGFSEINKNKIILAEYSDPNPFKPLHAGHLYTTLVGDAIARLLETTGAKVTRLNYGGDVGLHVGKTMWAIVEKLGGELPEKLNEINQDERAQWLGQCYVEGNTAYEENEKLKQEITEVNKKVYQLFELNDKVSDFAQIYWTCRQWSYDYFKDLYQKLGVVEFDRIIPESEVTELGLTTVREQQQAGTYKESDGAVIFDGEQENLHNRVFINSDGLPTYETKEIGLLLTKWKDYKFDKSLVITANEQAGYMKVVLSSARKFLPEPAERTIHLTHGVVRLSGGVKMSSRKGNVVGANDILNSAAEANKTITGKDNQSAVLAAVKYSFLKQRIGGDIIYDPIDSVNVLGNSGPYLQYAYVRAVSIIKKSSEQPLRLYDYTLTEPERSLVRKLDEYGNVLLEAAQNLHPHQICTYLYELAQEFNRFYEKERILGAEDEPRRLTLLSAYISVLKNGLNLLGIDTLEEM